MHPKANQSHVHYCKRLAGNQEAQSPRHDPQVQYMHAGTWELACMSQQLLSLLCVCGRAVQQDPDAGEHALWVPGSLPDEAPDQGQAGACSNTRPDPGLLDDVIGAIHALTPCAWFQCTVGNESLEWMGHTQAMLQIAASFGSSIRASTRQVLEYNWTYRAFFNSLSKRVPVTFKGKWTHRSTFDLSSNFLTEYALDVPGLLWRCDKFLQLSRRKGIDKHIILRLLTEIGICIARLKHWFLQRESTQQTLLYIR